MRFFTSIAAAALCFVANIQAAPAASAISTNPNQILELHNKFRSQHSAPPLKWSETLAQFAQDWSNRCEFAHSGSDVSALSCDGLLLTPPNPLMLIYNEKYGENIAAGYRDWEQVITAWYNEEKNYDYNDNSMHHATASDFTQLVWVRTTQVGCGVSDCQLHPIYTCFYDPPGNYMGEFGENVFPKKELPR